MWAERQNEANIMSPLTLSIVAFACILAGTLVGILLRTKVPQSHLSSDAKDVVRLGAGAGSTHVGPLLPAHAGSL